MLKGFPRRSYYGKGTAEKTTRSDTRPVPRKASPTRQPVYRNGKPAPQKKKIDSFEAEYQKFIADLKAKKAAEEAKKAEEVKVETPAAPAAEPTIEGLD